MQYNKPTMKKLEEANNEEKLAIILALCDDYLKTSGRLEGLPTRTACIQLGNSLATALERRLTAVD